MKESRLDVRKMHTVMDTITEPAGYNIYGFEEVIEPLGGRLFSQGSVELSLQLLEISYIFNFKLQSYLRLNTTFHHIYILSSRPSPKDFSENPCSRASLCKTDFIMILRERRLSKCQLYCGLMSNFISVPAENEFHIQMRKSYKSYSYYFVYFTFSLTDSGRVVSIPTSSMEISAFNKWMVYFPETGLVLQRFILKGKYFLHLKITLTLALENLVDIYDGPGLLCSKIKPSERDIAKVSYFTTSFQCIIYLKSYFHQRERSIKEFLEYVFHKNLIRRDFTLKEGTLLQLSDSECFIHYYHVCMTQLKAKQWLYFNITIKYISHEYKENMLCTYGGIVAYDIINSKHRDISRLCYVHQGNYSYRNIYSNTSAALLVIYSYREYGVFNVTLDVTITRCQIVYINVCEVSSQSIQVNSCVICQLKQLANKRFEENNLYSNWIFCRGYFDISPFTEKMRKYFINVKFTIE